MNSGAKIFIIILLEAVPFCEILSQESPEQKFNKGTELFSSGKYKEALDEWLSFYNSGIHSGDLDYNIGNAYFKLNNIPGAILFYERAHLLKPVDEDITYNLQIVKSFVVDKFNEIPELFFVQWFNFLSLTISTNKWAIISLISFILCLLFSSLYIYSTVYRHKVLGFWAGVIFIFLSFSSFGLSERNKSLIFNSHKAIIFCPVVNGKSSPDTSGTDLFVIHEGTKVTVEDEVSDWFEIRLSDGNKGWIPSKCFEKI